MKIQIEKDGARTIAPDFGVLLEGLRMAQRTTPTAIANTSARTVHDHSRSIVDIFSDPAASEALGPCSFHPGLPSPERDRAER